MRRLYEIRLANARTLAEEAGNALRFGEKLEMSKSQVSQIIGRSPVRQIGDELAERIEQTFGRPADWLDQDHSDHLLEMVGRLTKDHRAQLAEVVRDMLATQRKK